MRNKSRIILLVIAIVIASCNKFEKPTITGSTSLEKGHAPTADCPTSCIQDPTWTRYIAEFGAIKDDAGDDAAAFIGAADWINTYNSGSTKLILIIPSGTYRIKKQLYHNTTWTANWLGGSKIFYNDGSNGQLAVSALGLQLLLLNEVQNVEIRGEPGTKIVYAQKMYFGGWDYGFSNHYDCTDLITPEYKCSVGDFIELRNCSCININNIEVNGNCNTDYLGGTINSPGYQSGFDALLVYGGSNICVTDCNFHDMGRDGVMLLVDKFFGTWVGPNNVYLTRVWSEKNSRQGLSWDAGQNIYADDCRFSHSGTVYLNNPGDGIDIEPEDGDCTGGHFTNCKVLDNKNVGISSVRQSASHFAGDITFDNCKVRARDVLNGNAWSVQMFEVSTVSFINGCTIVGAMCHISGLSPTEQVTFDDCTITDDDNGIQGASGTPNSNGHFLLDFGGSGYTDNQNFTFSNCNINLHYGKLIYCCEKVPICRTFYNNTFNFYYSDMRTSANSYDHFSTECLCNVDANNNEDHWLGNFLKCDLKQNKFIDQNWCPNDPQIWCQAGFICCSPSSGYDDLCMDSPNGYCIGYVFDVRAGWNTYDGSNHIFYWGSSCDYNLPPVGEKYGHIWMNVDPVNTCPTQSCFF